MAGVTAGRSLLATAILAGSAALAGCGGTATTTSTTSAARPAPPRLGFGYDASRPLDRVDRGVLARQGGLALHDVSFVSGGEHLDAYLVEPAGKRRRPAIVLVHGGDGDRNELLGDAVALAKRGFVTMTFTEPSTADPPAAPADARALVAESRAVTVRDVIAVRRAADLLASLPGVDPRRIGYLGWSNGAKTGAFVAASDRRFKALALLSGGADTLAQFVAAAPAQVRPLVRRELGLVDPLRYIAVAPPGALLLEDGSKDAVVPHRALENMIHAAPAGTLVRWYPAGHTLNAAAYRAAFAWLAARLHPGA
jgi:dienelactone hydrolase